MDRIVEGILEFLGRVYILLNKFFVLGDLEDNWVIIKVKCFFRMGFYLVRYKLFVVWLSRVIFNVFDKYLLLEVGVLCYDVM